MSKRRNWTHWISLILAAPCSASTPGSGQDVPAPPAGHHWVLPPLPVPDPSLLILIEQNESPAAPWTSIGNAVIASVPKGGEQPQVIAYDELGDPIELFGGMSGNPDFAVRTYWQDSAKRRHLSKAGVASPDAGGLRAIAEKAFKEAKGCMVLPFIGEETTDTINKVPYAFKLRDENGAEIDSAKLRGKVVIVDLWATWCKPCMDSLPTLAKISRAHPDSVVVISISHDIQRRKAQAELEKLNVRRTWSLVFAPAKPPEARLWNLALHGKEDLYLPIVLVIDRTGHMIRVPPNKVEEIVNKLLEGR